ncbi:MAG: threonine/serine exporter family protein [Bacillota bacterium]|nr:threonine/serine exporter family protein [Bacillota bacterium]
MNISYLAVEAGKIILENGGETYRVEETINLICQAYNIKNADSYVTPTGIMFSAEDELGNNLSIIKRIKNRTINLEKVSMVNELSRKVQNRVLSTQDFEKELEKISSSKSYSNLVLVISSSLAAFFFTLLFKGSIYDALVSLIIGALLRINIKFSSNYDVNDFFINVVGGIITSGIALIFCSQFKILSLDKIIIGSIMPLVPGVALINSIRDTIEGDLVSGLARILEATLIALAIAVGTGIVIKLWTFIFGGIL